MDAATDAEEILRSKSIPRWRMLAPYIRSQAPTAKKILAYMTETTKMSITRFASMSDHAMVESLTSLQTYLSPISSSY